MKARGALALLVFGVGAGALIFSATLSPGLERGFASALAVISLATCFGALGHSNSLNSNNLRSLS